MENSKIPLHEALFSNSSNLTMEKDFKSTLKIIYWNLRHRKYFRKFHERGNNWCSRKIISRYYSS
jgi:hypothetical protein